MSDEVILPCHHCGKEVYDGIGMRDGHAVCCHCRGDLCYPPHEPLGIVEPRGIETTNNPLPSDPPTA